MKIPFAKTQTIGNDFVIVRSADVEGLELPELALSMCDRKFGIGSDGLLVVWPGDDRLMMRMFNPDGTEDYCGNGLRCAANFASSLGWFDGRFLVNQRGIDAWASVDADGSVTAEHLPAVWDTELVPVLDSNEVSIFGVTGTAISTGSTHYVVLRDELPGDEEFFELSPRIEVAFPFPEKTSIMWTAVRGPRSLEMRIWERGVGPTLGCGTGSMAAATVYAKNFGEFGEILVQNPGGPLRVRLESLESPIFACSTPEISYTGVFRSP